MSYSREFYAATDVSASCFVFASAGSGKTKILVDRYVKSLFLGIKPQEILCITFTNAAVFEMESRISSVLEKLYVNKDGFTEEYLRETLGLDDISKTDIEKAEGLFFEFQNNLNHLKIVTIHSFCQSLLQQFPYEAGIRPNFKILDENESIELLQEAKNKVLNTISKDVLKRLAKTISIKTLEEFVNKIYQLSYKFVNFFNKHYSIEEYIVDLSRLFHFRSKRDFSSCQKEFIETFLKGEDLDEVYLTKTGTLRKRIPFPNDSISKEIAEIVLENSENIKKAQTIDKTCNFLKLVEEIIKEYEILKGSQNALDFSEVLYRTKYLLTKSCAKEFVISRVCSSIKSIMIDEAQDLSHIQWELISFFSEDILTNSQSDGTIFVVGDIKQSIYRFQGADCKLFADFYRDCLDIFKKSGKILKTIYLDISYRTLPEILKHVDNIFEGSVSLKYLAADIIEYKKHKPFRKFPQGIFEIINTEDANPSRIAEEIIKRKTEDSLILTRSRGDLSEGILKELSNKGIEIAPPDRVKLLESFLVLDILAIADICMNQNNDYALACLLKSSYFFESPLSNKDLFSLCFNRSLSVFENLQAQFPEKYEYMQGVISLYEENALGKFFYHLASRATNLSISDRNVLSGFMDKVTKFSKNNSDNIPEFVEYIRKNDLEIVNQNNSKNALRLSTIHGAKGLEAKTVFLLNFPLEVDKQKTKFIFDDDLFVVKPSQKELFPEIFGMIENEYEEEKAELYRLLYVAMTRPRDNLYIINQVKTTAEN